MYASVIECTFKDGSLDEATALTEQLVDELHNQIAGLRGFIVIDRGDNPRTRCLEIVQRDRTVRAHGQVAAIATETELTGDVPGQLGERSAI